MLEPMAQEMGKEMLRFHRLYGEKISRRFRQYGLEVFLLHMKSQCGGIVGDRDRPLHGRGLLCLFLGELFFYVP